MASPVESPRSRSLILAIEADNESFVHSLVMALGGKELICLPAPDGRTPWNVANDGNHPKIAEFFRQRIGEALRTSEDSESHVGSLPKEQEIAQPVPRPTNSKRMRSFSLKLAQEIAALPVLTRTASY